ncbi:hypothetical protein MJG53_006822 [Ovis ammon polii x Ovis aries]|uniref:Uncharacterized protein n=1 Tax=Ovis ammon polii x Ovis aries TaxID=2918886 RepID=A0ACB9V632_9CETA|nr:hypothetical protein MJG53_006822 [Ovis ammon polii x Ovis aries]
MTFCAVPFHSGKGQSLPPNSERIESRSCFVKGVFPVRAAEKPKQHLIYRQARQLLGGQRELCDLQLRHLESQLPYSGVRKTCFVELSHQMFTDENATSILSAPGVEVKHGSAVTTAEWSGLESRNTLTPERRQSDLRSQRSSIIMNEKANGMPNPSWLDVWLKLITDERPWYEHLTERQSAAHADWMDDQDVA